MKYPLLGFLQMMQPPSLSVTVIHTWTAQDFGIPSTMAANFLALHNPNQTATPDMWCINYNTISMPIEFGINTVIKNGM